MASLDELMSLEYMAAYYEQKVLTQPPYLSESYFPAQRIATNALKYLTTEVSAPLLARASKFDAQALPTNRDSFQEEFFKTQFFRNESVINEQDLMDINNAYSTGQSQYLTTLIGNLFNNKTKDLLSMRARREYLGMQALANGQIDMNSNGIHLIVPYNNRADFQKDAGDWSDPACKTIFTDIQSAQDAMRKYGIYPNQIIMNLQTFRWIQNNNALKATVPTQNINIANGNLMESQVADFFKSELRLNVVVYDGGYMDSDLTGDSSDSYETDLHAYIPDGKVILLSAPLPASQFIVSGTNSTPVQPLAGGLSNIGHMNFAPTPEELGLRSGAFPDSAVQIFDNGVAYHEYHNDKLNQEEDLTAMNVLPSLEGSKTIFRLNVAPQNSGSNSSTNGSSSNTSSSTTNPPKA